MKRRISLLLAVVMVLGSFSFAFAANDVDVPEFLKGEKIFVGDKDGDLMLNKNLTREEAVVLLARLLKVEEEAEKYEVTEKLPSFKDTKDIDPYWRPFIAWAEDNEYFKGHEGKREGEFGFGDNLTAKQYAIVLLRALGYEEAEDWKKAFAKAEKLGLLKDVKADEDDEIVRKTAAQMTYNALGTEMADGKGTLAKKLGIKMPGDKPEKLEAKAYTENLKEVVVEFSNAELIKEENLTDARNYRIANNKVLDITVDEDSVILLLEDELVKGKSYSVLLRNLGKEVDGKKFSFVAKDNSIPEVVEVKALGAHGILVTTSEPVKIPRGRDFKVDGKNIAMDIEQYGRDIVLTPYYDKEVFPEDAKEITIEGLVDYANFKSVKQDFPIEVVKDEVAPEVKDVILKGVHTIDVVFDKDVYNGSIGKYEDRRNTGNVSYDLGRHTKYATKAGKIARNIVRYEFEDVELSRRADITVEGVTNHSKVAMEKAVIRVTEEIDYTEPEIISGGLWYHEASEKHAGKRLAHLIVEFDKDIEGNFEKPEDYFSLYEREVVRRSEIENPEITVSYLGRNDRLLVSIDNLEINNKDKDHDYILEIRDFRDTTPARNRMYRDYVEFELKTGHEFQVEEKVEIGYLYSDRSGREITLTFTHPVDRRSAEDGTNYIFRDPDGYVDDLEDLGGEAIVERDGKTVTLRIPSPFKETNYDTLEISIALKDKDGVRISGPRVYTFATKAWNKVDVTPIEKDTKITYIKDGKAIEKDELVLDKGTDMNTISVKITGKASDKAQVVVYNKDGNVEPTLVKTITIPASATEKVEALNAQTLAAGDKFTVVTKMGEEEVKLVVKAVETTKKVDVVYNADSTIKLADLAADGTMKLPYGTKVNDLPESAFTVTAKENATATFTKTLNKLFITVTAQNGEQVVYTVTLTEGEIDNGSVVTPATKTVTAGTAETITVVLVDDSDATVKSVKGIADKFVITHTGAADPTTVTVGEVTETTPGTYTFTVNNTATEAVTYTITVDGVALTTTPVITTN